MRVYTLIEMDYSRENFVDHSVNFKEIFGVVTKIIKEHYKEKLFVVEKRKIDFGSTDIIHLYSENSKQRFHFKIISKEIEPSKIEFDSFDLDNIREGVNVL